MSLAAPSNTHWLQRWIVGFYLVLAVASAAPIFLSDDSLSGIFLVLLAMPWSFLSSTIIDKLALDVEAVNLALLGLGILANTWILWKLTGAISHWLHRIR